MFNFFKRKNKDSHQPEDNRSDGEMPAQITPDVIEGDGIDEENKVYNPLKGQYEEDLKQKHTILHNVWFFDEADGKYIQASIDLFGHSSLTTCYENGQPGKKIHSWSENSERLEYKILETDWITVTLEVHNIKYRLSLPDYQKLKMHYDEINSDYLLLENQYIEGIYTLLPMLENDDELLEMTKNMIDDLPSEFFIDPTIITGIDCLIERRERIGRSILLSDELSRSSISTYEKESFEFEPDRYYIREVFSVENEEAIQSYLENAFFLLAKIIKARFDIKGEGQAIYLTYIFLYSVAIQYFSKKWADEYSEFFENIDDADLFTIIRQYCLIETINPQNLQTAGPFIYFLIHARKFEDNNYIKCFRTFQQHITQILDNLKVESFASKLKRPTSKKAYTINDIDLMNGLEFEQFLSVLFSSMGFETEITKGSGDQGIDLIISRKGTRFGVQAKCYSGSVGNSAIQEAAAGKNYYHLEKAIVVTNSNFTVSALELADKNGIVLWDRNMLKEKIEEYL